MKQYENTVRWGAWAFEKVEISSFKSRRRNINLTYAPRPAPVLNAFLPVQFLS
jgi:hypothetical protein